MKQATLSFVAFCCIMFSGAIACKDADHPCENRKYGYRRAFLKEPDIFIPSENPSDEPIHYRAYFEEVGPEQRLSESI